MNNYIKIGLGILATILLGAIGSGVWEYLLKPFFEFGTKFILNIATLGIETFKNDIYLQIAKGFMEKASSDNLKMLNTFYVIMIVAYFLFIKTRINDISKNFNEEKSLDETNNTKTTTSTLEKKLSKLKRMFYITIFLFGIIILFNYINEFKLKYINSSIAHYEQLKKASLPYITKENLNQFDSNFALIKNKKDYKNIINDLNTILKNRNLKIKESNIW